MEIVEPVNILCHLSVTMFGASAKWLSLMEEKNVFPKNTHKLEKLKIIYSTGSPLKPSSFDYVYKHVKNDVLLCSITGTCSTQIGEKVLNEILFFFHRWN